MWYREAGGIIRKHVSKNNVSIIRSFGGHVIGYIFHHAPDVPHFARNRAKGVMQVGFSLQSIPASICRPISIPCCRRSRSCRVDDARPVRDSNAPIGASFSQLLWVCVVVAATISYRTLMRQQHACVARCVIWTVGS